MSEKGSCLLGDKGNAFIQTRTSALRRVIEDDEEHDHAIPCTCDSYRNGAKATSKDFYQRPWRTSQLCYPFRSWYGPGGGARMTGQVHCHVQTATGGNVVSDDNTNPTKAPGKAPVKAPGVTSSGGGSQPSGTGQSGGSGSASAAKDDFDQIDRNHDEVISRAEYKSRAVHQPEITSQGPNKLPSPGVEANSGPPKTTPQQPQQPAPPPPNDADDAEVPSGAPFFAQDFLDAHNKYRCRHGVPLLVWSAAIAENARKWSIAANGLMEHSTVASRTQAAGFGYLGENLALGPGITAMGAVAMWYDEIKDTDAGSVPADRAVSLDAFTATPQIAHYTQLVWKGTTTLGCAINAGLVVCQYGEGGNYLNSFDENVLANTAVSVEACGGNGEGSPLTGEDLIPPGSGKCCPDECRSDAECNAVPGLFCCPNTHKCMDKKWKSTRGPQCNKCQGGVDVDGIAAEPCTYPKTNPMCKAVETTGGQAEADEFLAAHNKYRCRHGVPLLTWSTELADSARAWAQQAQRGSDPQSPCGSAEAPCGTARKSPESSRQQIGGFTNIGESLAFGLRTPAVAVQAWYGLPPRGQLYSTVYGQTQQAKESNPKFGTPSSLGDKHPMDRGYYGHYTQIVWKSTVAVGCGVSGKLIVCRYGEGGNVETNGGFPGNVFAPNPTLAKSCGEDGNGAAAKPQENCVEAKSVPSCGACSDTFQCQCGEAPPTANFCCGNRNVCMCGGGCGLTTAGWTKVLPYCSA